MEAAVWHTGSSSSDSSRRPAAEPLLDYLKDMLMKESMVDLHGLPEDAEGSYRTIMDSLYSLISEPPPLGSTPAMHASAFHLSSGHVPSRNTVVSDDLSGLHHSQLCDESALYEQHIDISKLCHDPTGCEDVSGYHQTHSCHEAGHDGQIGIRKPYHQLSTFTSKTHNLGFSPCSLPAHGNPHDSLEEQKSKTLPVKPQAVHSTFSQVDVMAHHRPLETPYEMKDAILGEVRTAMQCTGNSNLILPYFKFAPIVDISLEMVKDAAGYTALYVRKPSFQDASIVSTKVSSPNRYERKASNAKCKGSRFQRNNCSKKSPVLGNLIELLMSCAQALALGDVQRARQILQELYHVHGVSAEGNGMQRTAYFFCVALEARMDGTGGSLYRITRNNVLSADFVVKSLKVWFKVSPYVKMMHYFANQNILNAAEGASILHIVDYGIMDGIQWPCLINALADREGGPPLLVITGIESPALCENLHERLEACGHRLEAYARTYNVPFQFYPIVTEKWEDIDPACFHRHKDEILVINCARRLRHLADVATDPSLPISPRLKLLMSMHRLNPHLLLVADYSSACNTSFFFTRFREALYYYYNRLDTFETLSFDRPERLIVERNMIAREILSIVACEGADRLERPDMYRQCDARIRRAGFEQLPIPSDILSRSRSHVKQYYHKDYVVHDYANAWMLLGWKGRNMVAMSAWRPSWRQ